VATSIPSRRIQVDINSGSPSRVADQILSLGTESNLTLFLGAFLSSRAPSSLPTADDFKWELADSLWRIGKPSLPAGLSQEQVRAALSDSTFSNLPPELVVDEVLGRAHLAPGDVLSFVGDAVPNLNHRVVAALLDRGIARVVTTNFDELIEVSRTARDASADIAKLHGTISHPNELAIRLPQIGRGVMSRRLRSRVRSELDGRQLVIIGYSGRDLDLRPVLHTALCVNLQ
jgi:hypothetical protein